jgi:saccharopine dehydrogenase-like NADP-dependent oxidoreductase
LWQTTPKELADIGKTVADTIVALSNTRLWPGDVLAQAGTTMLVETGAAPGLESAMRDYVKAGGDMPEPEDMEQDDANPIQ